MWNYICVMTLMLALVAPSNHGSGKGVFSYSYCLSAISARVICCSVFHVFPFLSPFLMMC